MIQVSVVGNKDKPPFRGTANKVVEVSTTEELADLITKYHWAPSTFHALKGQRARKKSNFEQTSLLVLDVDDGLSLTEALKTFSKYQHIIATTKSHQKEKNGLVCDRYRVILFLNRVINSNKEFETTWFEAFKAFPFIDKACKDSSRFFYASNDVISVQTKGAKWPVSIPQPEGVVSKKQSDSEGLRSSLSKRAKAFLIDLPPLGSRHNEMVATLYDMRQQGFSEGDASSMCQKAYELAGAEWGSKQEARVRDVYSRDSSEFHDTRFPVVIKNKKGEIVPDREAQENYAFLLRKLSIQPYFDDFFERVTYQDGRKVDFLLSELSNEASRHGLSRSKERWLDTLHEEAERNHKHPIKDVIKQHISRPQDWIRDLSLTLQGPDPEWTNKALRKWLIGAMAKIYAPKGAQNLVLVLKGGQGIGKSRWFERLVKEFDNKELFGEHHIDFKAKDSELIHLRKFIFHLPELEAITSKREAGELKAFLTKNKVSVREAYARGTTEGYSRCSFCSSVNNDEFLVDLTGNRRFIVIEVDRINADHDINMLDVFQQAKSLWENGEPYWFEGHEIQEINERNEKYILTDPVDEAVDNFVKPGEDFVQSRQILKTLEIKEERKNFTKLKQLLKKNKIEYVKQGGQRGYLIDGELLRKGAPL